MQTYVNEWLKRQLRDDTWITDQDAWRFAVRQTVKSVVFANIVSFALHIGLDLGGLLPYPLAQALVLAFVATTLVSMVVSFFVSFVVGRAIVALSISRDDFARLSSVDTLSGLKNRRVFMEKLSALRSPAALLIFDIDRFKSINDTYGHVMGDEVIKAIGHLLAKHLDGPGMMVARLGGEEFGALIESGDGRSAAGVAEEVRGAIESMQVDGLQGPVTVSGGLADMTSGRLMMEAYNAADKALYVAKAGGRNRVVHEHDVSVVPARTEMPDPSPALRRQG